MIDAALPAALPALHVDGLLHLDAMVVLISAAYVGLDRLKTEPERFHTMLKNVESLVQDLLLSLEIEKKVETGKLVIKRMFEIYEIYFLCYVAKQKVELDKSTRAANFIKHQIHAPALWYFRTRLDLIVVLL